MGKLSSIKHYSQLLEKFNHLVDENEKKKALGFHDYSLMNALLKKTDEVNLHSNFIYSMINPESNHYCGNKFLEFFLMAIDETGFINLDNARVHKEVGKIDLLIEDGERVIVIENKLKAPDQVHQISRYIEYSIRNYLGGNIENLKDKIHIVYLSEYKKIPSASKQSCIGFENLTDNTQRLVWAKKEKIHLNNGTTLNLPEKTTLKFKRVKHSSSLLEWITLCTDWLKIYRPHQVSRSLDYAFNEYALILKRLDTKNKWRNLMSLDQYMLGLENIQEEKDMYAFMAEANDKSSVYIATKLFLEVEKLFPQRKKLTTIYGNFSEFTLENCIKWFKKEGNSYKDFGFEVFVKDSIYIFAFGLGNIVYGRYENNNFDWKNNIKTNRNNLIHNKNKNLFSVIEDMQALDNSFNAL